MEAPKAARLWVAVVIAACSGDPPTEPSFSGRFVLVAISRQPVASAVFRYTRDGVAYESTVAGDTLEILGASTIRRAVWFRTIMVRQPTDSVLPPDETQYCGSFTREGNRVEARLQFRRCSDPEGFQIEVDSFFIVRGGVMTRGLNPTKSGTFDAEWLFARR